MKIVDFMSSEDIISEMSALSMEDVLKEFSFYLKSSGKVQDSEGLVHVLLDREKLGSTGIGNGVAIPHGRLPGLDRILVVFGRSLAGVDFDAADGQPVHLFFLLVAPEDSAGLHLKTLARISRILKSPECRRALMEAKGEGAIYQIISQEDERH